MFFSRNRQVRKSKWLGDSILKGLANVDKANPFIMATNNTVEAEEPVSHLIPPNEILLGCSDEDYMQPVTIPYNGKSFGMAIIASKGDGKTQLVKHLAFSQLHQRFRYNLFFIDPKYDYSNLHIPQNDGELVERLMRYNIRPKGYDAAFYKPACFDLTDRKGIEYIVTLRDFEALEYNKRKEAMKEFFNIEEKTPAGRALEWILARRVPKTIKGFRILINEYKKFIIKERERAGSKVKSVSAAMDIALKERVDSGIIGEDGQKLILEVDDNGKPVKTKTVHAANFVSDLAQKKIVVLEADLDMTKSYISSCYLKIAIAQIWTDRQTYINTKGHEGVTSMPTFVVIDEADVLCPRENIRESPSRAQINQLLSKGRQFGWGVIGITQQPQMISAEFLRHVDYLCTTRIKNDKLIKLIQEKFALDDYLIRDLKNLEYDANKKVKKWALLTGNPNKPMVTFYPFPPQTAIKQEIIPTALGQQEDLDSNWGEGTIPPSPFVRPNL